MAVWYEEERFFESSKALKDEQGQLWRPKCGVGCCPLSLEEVPASILFEQLDDNYTPERRLACALGCTHTISHKDLASVGKSTLRSAKTLLWAEKISGEEFTQIVRASSGEQMADVAGLLSKCGKISAVEHEDLVQGLADEIAARERVELRARNKAMMREAEQYVGGRTGSPVVQGGLPSLGKRRP